MENCEKHGPYSVLCRMCDLETIEMYEKKYSQSDLEALRERCAGWLRERAHVVAAMHPDWFTAINELRAAASVLEAFPLTTHTEEGTK